MRNGLPAYLSPGKNGLQLSADYLLSVQHFDGFSRRLLSFYIGISRERRLQLDLSAFSPTLSDKSLTLSYASQELPSEIHRFLDQISDGAVRSLKGRYCHPAIDGLTDTGWQYYYFPAGDETVLVDTTGALVLSGDAVDTPFEQAFLAFQKFLFEWTVAIYETKWAEEAPRSDP